MAKFDIYKTVTDKIVAALEDCEAWERPWVTDGANSPRSINGTQYSGINYMLLSIVGGFHTSQLFGTYKSWQAKSAQVRKGERGNMVIFWKWIERKNKDSGELERFPFLRYYNVFAAEQVDGFDLDGYLAEQKAKMPNKAQSIASADKAVKLYLAQEGLELRNGGARAYYAPTDDYIHMPAREAFKSTDGYYSTLFHECGHSTGHKSRLDRDLTGRFGNEAYAFEELIAELCAAFTCNRLGIVDEPRADHAPYIKSWLKALKNDKRAIFTAASLAKKASQYIAPDPDKEQRQAA